MLYNMLLIMPFTYGLKTPKGIGIFVIKGRNYIVKYSVGIKRAIVLGPSKVYN